MRQTFSSKVQEIVITLISYLILSFLEEMVPYPACHPPLKKYENKEYAS